MQNFIKHGGCVPINLDHVETVRKDGSNIIEFQMASGKHTYWDLQSFHKDPEAYRDSILTEIHKKINPQEISIKYTPQKRGDLL